VSVASHLGIRLEEYDARIRTFIPDYDTMLEVAGSLVPPRTRRILDLGIGTGALSAQCLRQAPGARIVGIDADPEVLPLDLPVEVVFETLGDMALPMFRPSAA